MALVSVHRKCCVAVAILALLCLASCAVPLAPGYKIEKQAITVRFVPGSPPHLAVRAEYRLANVGNAPLDSIEVGLPDQKSFGRENLRVQVNGKDVPSQIARGEEAEEGESFSSEEWPVVWRIPFSPAWPRKHKRNLLITYDLAAAEPRGRMYVGARMFYLNDSGWFPNPIAPKSFLAKDLVRPDPSDMSVIVPQNFVATGSGELRVARKSGADTEYRFRLRKDDFDPFVIAGQYHEQHIATADGTVVFWTFKPMPAADTQSTGTQIAAAAKFFARTFGPLPGSMNAVYDVDLPSEAGSRTRDEGTAEASLPPGMIRAASEDVDGRMDLAHTWFAHMIVPQHEAWPLGTGLVFYAAIASSPGKNQITGHDLTSLISDYDADRSQAIEKPIAAIAPSDPQAQLQLARDKMQLFVLALEDRCGRDNLNHAIAHMISASRFQQYGYDDFRSAVEEECHQDLGPFFRQWLNEKGIPADFRAKYEAASEKKN